LGINLYYEPLAFGYLLLAKSQKPKAKANGKWTKLGSRKYNNSHWLRRFAKQIQLKKLRNQWAKN